MRRPFIFPGICCSVVIWLCSTQMATAQSDWPMAGANAARNSHNEVEVRGALSVDWYKAIEPYISQKVQLIAANDSIYVSTARGLYALDAETGRQRWVFSTKLPLGHSPTFHSGSLFVGGHDRHLYAIDADTGSVQWSASAGAGFQVNPLVADGRVYAGNRDGSFYAFDVSTGERIWTFTTQGAIIYSAAYQDGSLYFASQDSFAYALRASDGSLIWKKKLRSGGFHSYWPVVFDNYVVYTTAHTYLTSGGDPGSSVSALSQADSDELFPNRATNPRGTLISALGKSAGRWVSGTPTYETTAIQTYFQEKPWRRTVFVLNLDNGNEDQIAPYLWAWTRSGTRHPPVVGYDNVLYLHNNYLSDPAINGGHISGWYPGSSNMSIISSDWGAVDEPHAISTGGQLVYWNLCCNRQMGSIDIAKPNNSFYDRAQTNEDPTSFPDSTREWLHVNYNLDKLAPGYNDAYGFSENTKPYAAFGGENGCYGNHGDVNAPIPYQGRLYVHRGNTVFAFAPSVAEARKIEPAVVEPDIESSVSRQSSIDIQRQMGREIEKILAAGHLRPGYQGHGIWSLRAESVCGERLNSYFHHPSETLATLAWALPYVDTRLHGSIKDYMRNEYQDFPPEQTNDVGWAQGAAREAFQLPPEAEQDLPGLTPQREFPNFEGWKRNPYAFYGLWKYAQAMGEASEVFASLTTVPESPPSDQYLRRNPHVHNAYIAGYIGYLELQKLAGQSENTALAETRNRLVELRLNSFSVDSGYADADNVQEYYCRTLNVSNNFMFLVPELAKTLRERIYYKVEQAIEHYQQIAPYWFVAFAEEGYAENAINPLQDSNAMALAMAWVLQPGGEALEGFLDVPGFAIGDLYYIQKASALLHAYELGATEAPAQPQSRIQGGCQAYDNPDLNLLYTLALLSFCWIRLHSMGAAASNRHKSYQYKPWVTSV